MNKVIIINVYYINHCTKIVGVGSISIIKHKTNTVEFCVGNMQHIIDFILPIFDSFPLLTSKHYHYINFKQALFIANNSNFTKEEKNSLITIIKYKTISFNYISPI